ncbi:MAG: hypothetical protein HY678_09965, partial [Chloroflexi bacterium]|nr:hypothetical protein [Chloroflexota bacterium]
MRASRRETALAWSAQRLYRPYLRAAVIVALTLGFSTGAGALLLPAVPRTWRMS